MGDSTLFYKSPDRNGAPRRRGPDTSLDADDAKVTGEFHGQAPPTARYCVRRKVDAEGVGEVDWAPASERLGFLDGMAPAALGKLRGAGYGDAYIR